MDLRKTSFSELANRTIYMIKATSFEVMSLYHNVQSIEDCTWLDTPQIRTSFLNTVGVLEIEPKCYSINVEFTFEMINNSIVCFYNTVSRFNDEHLVEDYIKKHFPKIHQGDRYLFTDTNNFHIALQYINKV